MPRKISLTYIPLSSVIPTQSVLLEENYFITNLTASGSCSCCSSTPKLWPIMFTVGTCKIAHFYTTLTGQWSQPDALSTCMNTCITNNIIYLLLLSPWTYGGHLMRIYICLFTVWAPPADRVTYNSCFYIPASAVALHLGLHTRSSEATIPLQWLLQTFSHIQKLSPSVCPSRLTSASLVPSSPQ